METVSCMTDYLPVHMLFMAQRSERRFEDCLMSCPREGDLIKIDDREVFTRLLEERTTSLLLSMASLQSYLSYLGYEASKKLMEKYQGVTLQEFLEQNHYSDYFKHIPNRSKRRHETIMDEYGGRELSFFLNRSNLSLEDKVLYFSLIRSGKFISYKEGYLKKLMWVKSIHDELLSPSPEIAPQTRKLSGREELSKVFLRHELPEKLTPGRSSSDEYTIESYNENHFFWELLHCYPTRTVQEAVQYLHTLDNTENHFISVMQAAEEVDASGRPVTEPAKRYRLSVQLEG
ncbi:MAG: hypothetical protein R6V10_04410 [bacterium]